MDSINKHLENLNMEKNGGYLPIPKSFMTRSIHVGQEPGQWKSMAVIPPIVMSSNFQHTSPGVYEEFTYGRGGNPSRKVLETCLANLENAKFGIAFASGLGASTAALSILKSGDHILSGSEIYGGTNNILTNYITNFGMEVSFVDTTDVKKVEAAILPNTKLLYIESPTNPKLIVTDIKAVAKICKKYKIILAVDNSFLTSYLQRPLELGADLVIYSLSKYMNGHLDIVMGAVLTNDEELYQKLRFVQRIGGAVPSPFDCSQVNRSIKTLAIRMKQHSSNGLAVAKFLSTHPKIDKVLHTGLPSHPQYEISLRQTSGNCGMIGFYHKKGLEESKKFLNALKVFIVAGSLGGYSSLIALPSLMTHSSVPKDKLKDLQITDNFMRISVGLEDIEDLIADLNQALEFI